MSGNDMDNSLKRKYSVDLQTKPAAGDRKLPINKVGFFSFTLITWLTPLVWNMFRNKSKQVSKGAIWDCPDEEGMRANTKRMNNLWKEELVKKGKEKASFMNVWLQFICFRTFVTLLIISLSGLASLASSGLLVNQILVYLESEDNNLALGLGLTAAVLVCEAIQAISLADGILLGCQTGMRFRSGFMGIIYNKLLKMRTVRGRTTSEIINAFCVDSIRVFNVTWMIVFLWSAPIYVVMVTIYCYILIGYWSFVAIGTFVFCYGVQMNLGRHVSPLRSKCIQYTDARVRKMGEILNSIKFIKINALETPFTDSVKGKGPSGDANVPDLELLGKDVESVQNVRKSEQKYQMYLAFLNIGISSVVSVTPIIAYVITFTLYTMAGNVLTASTAFAVIGTMNFLRMIIITTPLALKLFGEVRVSFQRLKRLMLIDEFVKPSKNVLDKDNAVEIKGADFVWEDNIEESISIESDGNLKTSKSSSGDVKRDCVKCFELTIINFEVKLGNCIGICGPVGSGKSALISAVMGRMVQKRGHLAVNGNMAYVAQQAWIFNASLKDNVLFGRTYDAVRYRQAVSCCGLEPDIEAFPNGDDTEIGERGINLSGGQKQRVSLARAVYSNSDIYILDDPLSALDVKVGKQLFHACIKDVLKEKTILLVTHQLQYLNFCDDIYVIEDGKIVEQGGHQKLVAINGMYSTMLKTYEDTTVKSSSIEQSANKRNSKQTPNVKTFKGTLQDTLECTKTHSDVDKLVVVEEAAVGDIGYDTYNAYIQYAGGWFVATLVVLAYFIASGSIVFSDWWLSEWISSLNLNKIKDEEFTNDTETDTVVSGATSFTFDTYSYVYSTSLVGIIGLQLFKGFCVTKSSIRAVNKLHNKCLSEVIKAPMSFFESNPSGRILNRFSKDLDEADVYLPQSIEGFLRNFTLVLITIGMAAYASPWTLVPTVPIVILLVLMKQVTGVFIRQIKRLGTISKSPLISHVTMTSQGLPTVVAYRQQDSFFERCISVGDDSSVMGYLFEAGTQWTGLRLHLIATIITVSTTLIFVLTKGLVTPAAAGLILGLYGKTVAIVQYLVRAACDTEARFTSVERLNEYARIVFVPLLQALIIEQQSTEKLADPNWPEKGTITFRDVSMRYRPATDPVLRNINFHIRPKEKVGVVGRTGAGKSSLAVVLLRLVELCGGTIYVDDEDISKFPLSTLRSSISTITQDPVLFAGTIRYNVDPLSHYSNNSIWEALRKVHIKEKIEKYGDGLNVVVEENGENLSVGERQLICLARVVLRKSKILLLDEATANVDTSTDVLIQETIRDCFADCTVITIAHRLNTVLHNDKIIVLDSGQIVECGPPQDLINNPKSFFNSMINAQDINSSSL